MKPALIFAIFFLFVALLITPTSAQSSITVTKYSGNPIYNENGAKNVRWPVVQYQGGVYYLFYSHAGGATDSYLATSSDGLHFTLQGYALKRDPNGGAWDGGFIEVHTVFKYDATRWIMYYCGNPSAGYWHIGCAFSTDLITWSKYSGNPILGDSPTAADPCVIRTSAGAYLMYYANYDARSTWQIALAISNDGLSWSKYGTVLTYQGGTWYDYYVAPTGVMEVDGKILLMVIGKKSSGTNQNGLFESPNLDGTSFQEASTVPQPCIPTVSGTWESQIIAHSDFEVVNGVTYIYYIGYDGTYWQLGRATMQLGPQVTGNLKVVGCVDDVGVSCTAYYVGTSGTSDSVIVPVEGYVWSGLSLGSYTVYGTYQNISRSVTVTVAGQQTTEAKLNFATPPPVIFPTEIIVVGIGFVSSSVCSYAFLAKPQFARRLRAKLRVKRKAKLPKRRRRKR
jgi:hypothetical protein